MTDYEKGWQAAVNEAAEWIYRNACKTKYLYNGGVYSAGMETDFKEYMQNVNRCEPIPITPEILEKRMAVEMGIKINLQNVVYYGAYYQGALDAAKSIIANYVWGTFRGDDKIYRDAELELIKTSKHNMQLFLDGTRIAYRNHKRHKSGKLEKVEAYFIEDRNVIQEVK